MTFASELWTAERIEMVATAAVIMPNMTVAIRRNEYRGDGIGGRSSKYFKEDDDTVLQLFSLLEDPISRLERMAQAADEMKHSSYLHHELRQALIEHNWNIEDS